MEQPTKLVELRVKATVAVYKSRVAKTVERFTIRAEVPDGAAFALIRWSSDERCRRISFKLPKGWQFLGAWYAGKDYRFEARKARFRDVEPGLVVIVRFKEDKGEPGGFGALGAWSTEIFDGGAPVDKVE